MEIIETSYFTRRVIRLLSDAEYNQLQLALVNNPELGDLLKGGGGLRKVRWSIQGRGKRSGVRSIYYWAKSFDQILMLLIYTKNEQEALTTEQLKVLRRIIEEEYP